MRNFMLFAGVAALSMSVPAIAMEKDRGRGHGRGAAAAQVKGEGNARAERRQAQRGERRQARRGERGQAQRAERRQQQRAERLDRRERRIEHAIQQERRDIRQARVQGQRNERGQRLVREARRDDRRDWRRWTERRAELRNRPDDGDHRWWRDDRPRRLAIRRDGCPPGLARQNRWCLPPGQLRRARMIGQRLPVAAIRYNIPDRYRYRFADNDRWSYRYDDTGFVYRIDSRTMIVNNVVPLFGSNLMVGEPMPIGYDTYNLPMAYRSYYPDSSDHYYRYDESAIYQVDAETRLVEGIVALLTGGVGGLGGLGIGDTLPAGYDVYNVPFDYRDRYADTDDSWYRYADGSIYEVDPQTRLIESIISTLA